MLERLEREVQMMLNECEMAYNSKDTNKINAWLELNYHPFRKFWIEKVGEDTFAETWNRLNRASK